MVGQPNMTSFYNPSVSSSSLSYPQAVFSDGTRLYVADQLNSRILIWNSIPTTNPAPGASIVIGQQNMTSNGAGTTATTMTGPSSVFSDGTKLYIADTQSNRVLILERGSHDRPGPRGKHGVGAAEYDVQWFGDGGHEQRMLANVGVCQRGSSLCRRFQQ